MKIRHKKMARAARRAVRPYIKATHREGWMDNNNFWVCLRWERQFRSFK